MNINFLKKPTALILDWDNLLIDSKSYYRALSQKAMKIAVESHGFPRPEISYVDKTQKSIPYFISQFGKAKADQLLAIRNELLFDPNEVSPELMSGAIEFLRFINFNQIPCAVFSDTIQSRLEYLVSKTLRDTGTAIPILVGHIEAEIPRKPEIEGILKALKLLETKHGIQLPLNESVLMVGDLPKKDGLAAMEAGINHIIIPTEDSGDLTGWNTVPNLEKLVQLLAKCYDQELRRPCYFKRFSYKNIPIADTAIIKGDLDYIESPATDNPNDGITLLNEELDLHNLRWIAKRGKHLDGTGNYSKEAKLAAGRKVVEQLLTSKMVEEVVQRVVEVVSLRRLNNPENNEKIIIHNPNIGYSKNMLRIAFIQILSNKVNNILTNNFKELNIELQFGDQKEQPIFNVLSILQSFEELDGLDSKKLEIFSLTGHEAANSLTQKRSTGSLIERIVKQALFSYHNFKPDDLVILVDDHVQTGATLVTLYQQLTAMGVKVVAMTSLATIPESINLQANTDLAKDMERALDYTIKNYILKFPNTNVETVSIKFRLALENTYNQLGLSIPSLTNREALSIMAFLINGEDSKQLKWFYNVMKKYGCNSELIEREGDSLQVQARKPAVNPIQFRVQIEKMIPKFLVSYMDKIALKI